MILGDQLNAGHSWFKTKSDNTLYVIAELKQETNYVKHHTQKVVAFFAAMEQFAQALRKAGHHVLYLTLDDTHAFDSLESLLHDLMTGFKCEQFEYQRPDEYRVIKQLREFGLQLAQCSEVDTEHFMLPFEEIELIFEPKKHHTMEFFYRMMRKRFKILMQGNKPLGDKWNFDGENRSALKQHELSEIPEPLCFSNNVSSIVERLTRHKVATFGECTNTIIWPVTRLQAIELLNYFCQHQLVRFGQFQDAMTCQSQFAWSLFHSRLSFALNAKILHPSIVIQSAIQAFEAPNSGISLAQIEGFVRQILGWREFIRGIYWRNMPEYETYNTLNATRALPHYFWNGQTNMRCVSEVVKQSLKNAYAHHIQRLMVTGNFALLTGLNPNEVDKWYLGIYIDALQWVELPNTRGMSLHADNGIIATKPYAGGGNYINKMSDYCKHCHYNVKTKHGDKACPFNSLFWDFLIRHQTTFETNPRMAMMYRTWQKQSSEEQHKTLQQAQFYLSNIEQL
ncbi:FIG004436: Protein related to deoxyribodipyrimidine photolyase [Pseudoalteromonas luteoviolacea B = ATCC 29581]|nr:FIG004436: Protein related to deoxyribodipyrimidine photolyase [Pseudoalteromonas luteoviolacea B = ATCC 29581]